MFDFSIDRERGKICEQSICKQQLRPRPLLLIANFGFLTMWMITVPLFPDQDRLARKVSEKDLFHAHPCITPLYWALCIFAYDSDSIWEYWSINKKNSNKVMLFLHPMIVLLFWNSIVGRQRFLSFLSHVISVHWSRKSVPFVVTVEGYCVLMILPLSCAK